MPIIVNDLMDDWKEWLINECYHWIVPSRYANLSPLGHGSFGLVCSAEDTLTKKNIAIKKLSRPFETSTHAKRAYREVKLLKHVKHENIILLLDIFSRTNSEHDLNDIYLCTNLMSTNLKEVLLDQKLTDNQIRIFTYQIIRGIKYLHSANIIHRDLKPDNITVQENLDLRIIDFGLARSETEKMTGYVANRWYRAPEIMLKWMSYSKAVDIWSIGCILAEMYSQKVLFKGDDHISQLNLILEVTGFPSESILNQINQDARTYLENKELKTRRVNFNEYFSHINCKEAVNMIDKMIELDPEIRIKCDQALEHPFLEHFHDPNDEPTSELFDEHYETEDCSIEEWKRRIFQEIKSFVPPSIENE